MPAASEYFKDQNSTDAIALDRLFGDELDARLKQNKASWAYYEGNHQRHLKPDGTKTDDNLTINLVESFIDKSVSGLMGTDDHGTIKGVKFDIVDEPGERGFMDKAREVARRALGGKDEPSPEQAYLDEVLNANKQNILLLDSLLNGAVTGHTFIKIQPDGVEGEDGSPLPRLINLNPDTVTVFWDEADVERVLWYRIQFGAEGKRTRQDIVRDGESWLIYNYKEKAASSGWDLEKGGPVKWKYAWPPIVD